MMSEKFKPDVRESGNLRMGIYLHASTREHYVLQANDLLEEVREAIESPVSSMEAEQLRLKLELAREYRELGAFNARPSS